MREVTGRLISMVVEQATDCCYMTDRDKKKKKTTKDRQKHRKGSAPYGETKGTLCSYEISSKMHFS